MPETKPGNYLDKNPADIENAPPKRGFSLLSLFRGLASSRRLGPRCARLSVLSQAIVDEVTPLHEVDGGILLGCLCFA